MREELKRGDFGFRRKRNIDLGSNGENEWEIASGINWSRNRTTSEQSYDEKETEEPIDEHTNEELIDGYEEVKIEEGESKPLMIGTKPININKLKKKKQQDEVKVTVYLDKQLVKVLQILKKDKMIDSYSQCVKDSLEQYLTS